MPIADLIDLQRYPMDRPESAELQNLIARGQSALKTESLFALEGFLRKEVISAMAEELEGLIDKASRFDKPRIAYSTSDPSLPPDHPINRTHETSYHQVLNYQIANNSPLREIFAWEPLTDFLRILCGYESFYRSECPHLALTAKIAGAGDSDGWHFDSNDVVFSLLLQAAEQGGAFEYVPYLRTEEDQRFEAVDAVMRGACKTVRSHSIERGTFTVFKGDLSLHRVTMVSGARRRIVALFSYDQKPGTRFSQSYIEELQRQLP